MFNEEGLVGWDRFKLEIIVRFGTSPYDNHFGKLTKLMQIGTVLEHIDASESALRRTRGLPQDQLVSSFVSG